MLQLLHPKGRAPCIQWIGDWVGPKDGLDTTERKWISFLYWESDPSSLIIKVMTALFQFLKI
jgi:hypothetical protein